MYGLRRPVKTVEYVPERLLLALWDPLLLEVLRESRLRRLALDMLTLRILNWALRFLLSDLGLGCRRLKSKVASACRIMQSKATMLPQIKQVCGCRIWA